MTTPTPPGGDDPTTALPQTPPTGQPFPDAAGQPGAQPGVADSGSGSGATPPPGAAGPTPPPIPPKDQKDKTLPWKIATGVLALTTIGLGAWGLSTNSKLNDLQASTDQEIAALQQQVQQISETAGKKESEQAKEIAALRGKVSEYKGNLKVDTAKIKQESGEINQLSNEYKAAQARAQRKEGNLQAQLTAAQAEAALAKKCASVMASGLIKIYEDVPTIVTYKEVDAVLKEASADCGDVVSVQVP